MESTKTTKKLEQNLNKKNRSYKIFGTKLLFYKNELAVE